MINQMSIIFIYYIRPQVITKPHLQQYFSYFLCIVCLDYNFFVIMMCIIFLKN